MLQGALEVSAEEKADLIVAVAAPDQAFGQFIDPPGVVETGDIVSRMGIEIEIAAQTDVLDSNKLHGMVEVIQNILDRDGSSALHKLTDGSDSENASTARGGADDLIGLAAGYAWRKCAAV